MIGIGVGINRYRFAGGFAGSYSNRVLGSGGVIESLICVANASTLLQSATFLLIPSGYKAGTAYSVSPSNGNGDLSWTRGSSGSRTLSNGSVELPRTNHLTNSVFAGGVVGSPGTLPTGYTQGTTGGLSREVVGFGIENGLNYFDLRLSGTANANVSTLNLSNLAAATTDQTWTHSLYAKAINSAPNAIRLVQVEFDITSSYLTEWASLNFTLTSNLERYVFTRTTSGGINTARVQTALYFAITNGQYYDFTVRLAAPQMELSSSVSEWIATQGTARTTFAGITQDGTSATNVPRLSYMYESCPALLLEPQRTNSILNSVFAGSGSTPISWNRPAGTGSSSLTTSTIGSGVQACSQSATNERPFIEQTISVLANTTYYYSVYIESVTGTVNYDNIMIFVTLPTGATTSYFLNNVSITGSSQATSGRLGIRLVVGSTAGNVTLRIGLGVANTATGTILFSRPQFEQGSFPTTFIPTTTAPSTRNVDRFSRDNIRDNGLIGTISGTWFVELRNNIQYVRDAATFPLFISSTSTSGASSNSIEFRVASASSSRLAILKRINGTGTPLLTTTTDTIKVAIKWNSTRLFLWVNGSEVSLTGGVETFAVNNFQFLNGFGTDVPLFIQQMALFNTALSDSSCQALTTL